jgi:cytochrome P450
VPYTDRALFQRVAEILFDGTAPAEVLQQSIMPLFEYMYGLLVQRKAEPGDDVFSVMIERGQLATPPMTDIELITMAAGLLVAGHDTTASLITYGTLALLDNPERYTELRENPGVVPNAVEETLRYLSTGTGLLRVATVDTELAGVPIAAGDYVIVGIHPANHDPAQFDHPERLDFHRGRTTHLGFGHGPHQCVGQQIARLELTTALGTLPRRVPSLRLAVPFEQIEFKRHTTVLGPRHLPVTWDEVLPADTP